MAKRNPRILVIGAVGQVHGADPGPAQAVRFRERRGRRAPDAAGRSVRDAGPFETVDATDMAALRALVREHDVDVVYHLSTILSGDGEKDPERAWHVNVGSLKNVLDLGVEFGMRQIFWPSSIAVFGPTQPPRRRPAADGPRAHHHVRRQQGGGRESVQLLLRQARPRRARAPLSGSRELQGVLRRRNPRTIRSRSSARPWERGHYTCFVDAGTMLPLMYMEDAIRATLELMAADTSRITVRTSYNVSAVSFTAGDLATEVARRVDGFTCDFEPDFRQAIADSWPDSMGRFGGPPGLGMEAGIRPPGPGRHHAGRSPREARPPLRRSSTACTRGRAGSGHRPLATHPGSTKIRGVKRRDRLPSEGRASVRGRRLDVQPSMSATLTPRILVLPRS